MSQRPGGSLKPRQPISPDARPAVAQAFAQVAHEAPEGPRVVVGHKVGLAGHSGLGAALRQSLSRLDVGLQARNGGDEWAGE